VGDKVKEGDILAQIDADKAKMEFESFNAGTLLYIGIEEGGSAPVDSILAILGPAGTDVSGIVANFKIGGAVEAPKTAEKVEAIAATSVATPVATNTSGRIFASPLAKKIAQDKGIDLAQIAGSGENGRITKTDVENFTPSATSSAGQAVAQATATVAAVKPFVPAGEVFQEEIKIRKCVK